MDGIVRRSPFLAPCPVRWIALDYWPEALPTLQESFSTQRNGFRTTTSFGICLFLPEQPAIFALSCGMQDNSGYHFLLETRSMSYSVDKLIEEWLAEKRIEELPGTGKPLNLDEYFSWPEDQRIGLSLLKNSGCVPFEVELIGRNQAVERRRLKNARTISVKAHLETQAAGGTGPTESQNRAVASPQKSLTFHPQSVMRVNPPFDVLVVGAGPVGLTMACELARSGVRCRIIDKAGAPASTSRALGIFPRTLEMFQMMGMVDPVLEGRSSIKRCRYLQSKWSDRPHRIQ